jgi:hypothetical protein
VADHYNLDKEGFLNKDGMLDRALGGQFSGLSVVSGEADHAITQMLEKSKSLLTHMKKNVIRL